MTTPTTAPEPAPPTPPTVRRSFSERLIGAIRVDARVYAEIEHDPDSMGQAAAVVALASLASLGAALGSGIDIGAFAVVASVVGGLIGWAISAALVWLVGVRIMGHTSHYAELLRTLGFAAAPRLIGILGFVPVLGWLAGLAAGILGLIAYVVAVREALDVSTGRAILVCILAYLAVVVALIALVAMAGFPPSPTV